MISIQWNFLRSPGWIFVLLGTIFTLVGLILLGVGVNQLVQQQRYQAGQCTITARELRHQLSTTTTTHTNGNTSYTTTTTSDVYAPYFEYTVHTADGRSYTSSGYDGSDTYTSDRAGQQAIMESYQVEKSYACWYDPARPARAVLVRHPDWLLFILGGGFALFGLLFGGIGLFLVVLLRRQERPSSPEWSGEFPAS